MQYTVKIEQFLDDAGRITQFPSKQRARLAVLQYLAGKFELEHTYTERQVNEVCDRWHTFGDYFLLRRELIDNGLLCRVPDGSRYWRVWEEPPVADEADAMGNEPDDSNRA